MCQPASIFVVLHIHVAIAVNEAGVNPLGLAENVYAQPAPLHLSDQRGELQFGDARADAAVDAIAERQVPPRIFAVDDDPVSVGEDALVAVRRDIPECELVALPALVAEEFSILGRGAPHMRERGLPADDLVPRVDRELGVVVRPELRALLGKFRTHIVIVHPPLSPRVVAATTWT